MVDGIIKSSGTEQPNGTSTTAWGYDAASELTTLGYDAASLLTDTLGYDPAGELTSLRVQLNGTLAHNDVVTSTLSGDRAAVSDLLSGAAASYGWDQADRLISASNGLTASSYAYNGDGLRMSKTVSGMLDASGSYIVHA